MVGDQVTGTPDLHSLTAAKIDDATLAIRLDVVVGQSNTRTLSPIEAQANGPHFASAPSVHARVGELWTYPLNAVEAQGGAPLTVSVTQSPAGMSLSGAAPSQQLAWTPTAEGQYMVSLQAKDAAGKALTQTFLLYVSDDRKLPVEPSTVATLLPESGMLPFAESTAFLYQGSNPIQTGVAPNAIELHRATVVRGQVLNLDKTPIAGVTISVLGHPEYGTTKTRADGWFDMAANGGDVLIVEYRKPGYLPVQRKVRAPWREFWVTSDVVMTPFDAQYANIQAGSAQSQLYWGNAISDGRGDRRTALYFPPGTTAQAVLANGSKTALTDMTVRVSEYTVGSTGEAAMPGELPRTVGYTWASNYSVDQAEALGAVSVEFSKPVISYTSNFIGTPVGTAMPAGWYDFTAAAWKADNNGRVIKVLSIDGDKAVLQVTEDPRAATSAELTALGITEDELRQLASLFPAQTELWRTPLAHFTPWDCNVPYGPPSDAEPPPWTDPIPPYPDPEQCGPNMCCDTGEGSDIFFQEMAVGQRIALPGTSYSLYYKSSATGQSKKPYKVKVTGAKPLPQSLRRADVVNQIAGRKTSISLYAGTPADTEVQYSWDGKDAYGRDVPSGATAVTDVSYIYPAVRYVREDLTAVFDRLLSVSPGLQRSYLGVGGFAPDEIKLNTSMVQFVPAPRKNPAFAQVNAGSWGIDGLRFFDASNAMIYNGDGSVTRHTQLPATFVADVKDQTDYGSNGIYVIRSSLVDGRGAVVYADRNLNQIKSIQLYGPDKGKVEILVGPGSKTTRTKSGAYKETPIGLVGAIAMGNDGSLFFMDEANLVLKQLKPDGTSAVVAGNGSPLANIADGAVASQTPLEVRSMVALDDGHLVAVTSQSGLVSISPAGRIFNVPIPGGWPASKITQSHQGDVWVTISTGLYRLEANGTLTEVFKGPVGQIYPGNQSDVFVGGSSGAIDRISRSGEISRISSGSSELFGSSYGWGSEATAVVNGVAPDGRFIVTKRPVRWDNEIQFGKLDSGMNHVGDPVFLIGTSDGQAAEEFDKNGLPIRMRSGFGGQTLSTYVHDAQGRISTVTDSHGNVTTFERDPSGRLAAVVSPFGLRTILNYDGAGNLDKVTLPGGLVHRMTYDSIDGWDSLLATYTDATGHVDTFSYDSKALLSKNVGPDGGGWTLKAMDKDYKDIQVVSAEGAVSRYQRLNRWNENELTTIHPDGTKTITTGSTERTALTAATGAALYNTMSGDPRFGAVASTSDINFYPKPGERISSETSRKVSFGLDNRLDPYEWSETTTVNRRWSWVTRWLGNNEFSIESPSKRTTTIRVDTHMQPSLVTTPSGAKLALGYNSRGQLDTETLQSSTGNRATTYTYHPAGVPGAGQLATTTDPLGRSVRFDYNTAGRLTIQTQPDGRTLRYDYDNNGNLSKLTTPAGVIHSFDYTPKDRPSLYTAPGDSVGTQWRYNKDRQLQSIHRPGSQSVTVSREPSGRVSGVQATGAANQTFSYYANGLLKSVATSDGQAVSASYDGAKLIANGFALNGNAATLSYGYDPQAPDRVNQLTMRSGGDTATVDLKFNNEGETTSVGPMIVGRDGSTGAVASLLQGQALTNMSFNDLGELEQKAAVYKGAYFSGSEREAALMALVQSLKSQVMQELYRRGDCTVMVPQGYECQAEGRTPVKQALSKFGKTAPLAPNHGGKGKSKRAKDGPYDNCPPIPDGPKEPPLWQSTDFCSGELWRFDQVVSAIAGQQTSQSIQYALDVAIHRYTLGPSGFPEITPFVAKPPPASYTQSYLTPTAQALYDEIVLALNDRTLNWGTALKRSYTRNAGGQIKRVDEVLEGYTVPARLYDYNNLGQLTKVTIGATSNTWDYDANGNRTHENGIEIAKYDNQDRLLTWRDRSYTYNAAGDLETRTSPAGTTNYVYDALGALRVVRLPNGKTITYDIDPSGRRTGKRVDGQQQWHLVWQSQLKPIAQLKPDGSIDAVFYYAEHVNVPSAMRKGGKDYQIVTDHLGSVRLVIDVATAQVVQRMNYDSWGAVTEDSNPGFQPFGFAGGIYDPDTQLTRFGVRDYDGETGRWTAKDPILFEGGDSNLFGYVLQDPNNYFDPEGFQSVDSVDATLKSAISRGDVKQLEKLMEMLGPQQRALANQAIEKFKSKATDWISANCKGSINREFPQQFREKTLKEILDASRTGDKMAKKAWKLLNDNRFQK